MAQRLEVTMSNGTAEVNHRGKDVTINLPVWMRAQDAFFDEDGLVEHCAEHGILLATLQAGFAQHLIEIRAQARPQPLPPAEKGGDPIPQEITEDGAQERVDGFKPMPRTPAEDAVTKAAKLLRGLTDAQKAALKAQGLI